MEDDRIKITVGNDRYYRKSSRRSSSISKEYLSGPVPHSPSRYPSKNSPNGGEGGWQREKFSQEPPADYYNPKRRDEGFHNERDYRRPPNNPHDYPPPGPRSRGEDTSYFRRSRSPVPQFVNNYHDEKGDYNRFDGGMSRNRLSPQPNDHYNKRMRSPSQRSAGDYDREIPLDQNSRNREPRPVSSVHPRNWTNKEGFSYGKNRADDLDYPPRPRGRSKEPVAIIDLRDDWSPHRSPGRNLVDSSYEDRSAIFKEADERYQRKRSMAEHHMYDQDPSKLARNNSISDNIGPELKKYVRGFDHDNKYDSFSNDRQDYFQKSLSPLRGGNDDNAITPGGFNKNDVSNILKVVGIEAGSAQTYLNKFENKKEDPYKKMRKNSEKDPDVFKSFPPGYDRSFSGADPANNSGNFGGGKGDCVKPNGGNSGSGVMAVLKQELNTQKEKCIKMINDGNVAGNDEKDIERLQMLQTLLNKCQQADVMDKQKKQTRPSFIGISRDEEVGGEKFDDENERSKYGDGGQHLCGVCKRDFDELPEFLAHLHSNLHKALMDETDRPWATNSSLGPNDSALPDVWSLPLKGADTLVPVTGFYCTVCSRFCGDKVQAEQHLLSCKHNEKYLTSFKDSVLKDIDKDGNTTTTANTTQGGTDKQLTDSHFRGIEMKQETFLANLMRKRNPKTHVLRHYQRKDDSSTGRKYNTAAGSSTSNERGKHRRSRSPDQSPVRNSRSARSPMRNRGRRSSNDRRRSSTDRSPPRRSSFDRGISTYRSRAAISPYRGSPPRRSPDRRRSPPRTSSYRKRSVSPVSKKRKVSPDRRSPPRRTTTTRRASRRSPPPSNKKSPGRSNSKQERRSYEIEADKESSKTKSTSSTSSTSAVKKPERKVSIADGNLKVATSKSSTISFAVKKSSNSKLSTSSTNTTKKSRPEKAVEPLPPGTE